MTTSSETQQNEPAAQPPEAELLPCPFCGEVPVYLTDFEDDKGGATVHHVSCGLCFIQPGIYGQASKEEAVRKWNTRPSPTVVGQSLCREHKEEFTLFEVGGCLVCWQRDTRAPLPRAGQEAGLTVEECLAELQKILPGEFFRVSRHEDVEINESGELWVRNRWCSILQLSRGLDGFYNAPSLDECINAVRAWAKSRAEGEKSCKS